MHGVPNFAAPSCVAPNSGVGREFAKGWETAIRQALMPVIFQDNPPALGKTPHRKCLEQHNIIVFSRCWITFYISQIPQLYPTMQCFRTPVNKHNNKKYT